MRTFIRIATNTMLLIAALGTEAWLVSRPAFQHATVAVRGGLATVVAAAYFTVAWFAMRVLKSKPQDTSTAWTPARPVRKRARV